MLVPFLFSICLFSLSNIHAADINSRFLESVQKSVAEVAPSIVMIETAGGLDRTGRVLKGEGPTTGVVFTADGFIVTSAFNFFDKPSSILVTLPGGKRHPATLLASDRTRMISLLKIKVEGLPVPAWAPKKELKVGQWTVALGRTWGGEQPSLSVGILSATERLWRKAIQTDAKISPANYGGPLIDLRGRVMGVLVPLSPTRSGETAGFEWYDSGIGFAVPMEDIREVFPRLKAKEELKRGLMGIHIQGNLYGNEVEILRVGYGSPAAAAGIRKGDRIVEVDGQKVERPADLRYAMANKYAGDRLSLEVMREGKSLTLECGLVEKFPPYTRPYLGVVLDRAEANKATIGTVLTGSPAERAGLQAGDQVFKFGQRGVSNRQSLQMAVWSAQPEEEISVDVKRNGQDSTFLVKLERLGGEIPDEPPVEFLDEEDEDHADEKGEQIRKTMKSWSRTYWAYIPPSGGRLSPPALMVWLHPHGKTFEDEILTKWQTAADERGIALLGILASEVNRWGRSDIAFAKAAIKEFQKEHSVDANRVVLHGHSEGANVAFDIALKERRTFKGVIASGLPRRIQEVAGAPQVPFSIFLISAKDSRSLGNVDKVRKVLEEKNIPLHYLELPQFENGYLPQGAVEAAAVWLSLIDRI